MLCPYKTPYSVCASKIVARPCCHWSAKRQRVPFARFQPALQTEVEAELGFSICRGALHCFARVCTLAVLRWQAPSEGNAIGVSRSCWANDTRALIGCRDSCPDRAIRAQPTMDRAGPWAVSQLGNICLSVEGRAGWPSWLTGDTLFCCSANRHRGPPDRPRASDHQRAARTPSPTRASDHQCTSRAPSPTPS